MSVSIWIGNCITPRSNSQMTPEPTLLGPGAKGREH